MTCEFYLRHFFGFMIQFGFCSILCLIPFRKTGFRFSRKMIYLVFAVMMLADSAVFSLLTGWLYPLLANNIAIFGNFFMLAAILLFSLLYFRLLRADVTEKLMVVMLTIFYAATQYLLVNLITPVFSESESQELYAPEYLFLFALTAAILFPIMAVFLEKVVSPWIYEIGMDNIRREFMPVLLMTVIYLALIVFYSSWMSNREGIYWWLIIPPFLLTTAILFIYYWRIFWESVRRRRDEEYRRTMEIQSIQYKDIQRDIENTRRMRHDMRHFLSGLYQMLQNGETERAISFLEEGIQTVDGTGTANFCRDSAVNALLQYYVHLAEEEDIHCRVKAECEDLRVSPVDLTILFENAMENAIHACGAISEQRWMNVQVGVLGGNFIVQITNPCRSVRPSGRYRLNGEFLPAEAYASQNKGGGYGLESIARIAEKYDGEAGFRYDAVERTFTTRIIIELHEEGFA
ncbi:MAG: GHKL domain-containing protein [Clostridiales bacterium]|nr:GHKL domain-containing protein [Clostridiales bacterium]